MLSRTVSRQLRIYPRICNATFQSCHGSTSFNQKNVFIVTKYQIQNYATIKDIPNIKTANKTESQEEEKKIHAMPKILTNLITDTRTEGWPSLNNISLLASKCNLAGVNIDQVESYLVIHFRSKSNKKTSAQNREPNFFTKHTVKAYFSDDKVDKVETLTKFLDYMEKNIYKQQDKMKMPIKRLEYTIAMWRLALIIEDCILNDHRKLLNLIEDFAKRNALDTNVQKMIDYSLLSNSSPGESISAENLEILLDFICDPKMILTKRKSDKMPNLLLHQDLSKVLETCMKSESFDKIDKMKLRIRHSQVCWETSNFSESLESLGNITREYLAEMSGLTPENVETEERLLSLSLMFVDLWRNITISAVGQKMTPATEYLVTLCRMFSGSSATVLGQLPSYLVLLAAKSVNSNDTSKDVIDKIENDVSDRVKSEKFERCFIVIGMTTETKLFFTKDYMKRLIIDTISEQSRKAENGELQEIKSNNVEELIETKADSKPSQSSASLEVDVKDDNKALYVDILDLSVMELMQQRKIPEMVDKILTEYDIKDILPSDETLKLVTAMLVEIGDLYSLISLEKILPDASEAKSDIQEKIVNFKLQSYNKGWESGQQVESWVKLVELYRSIWDDRNQGRIRIKTGERLLARCRQFAKLFIEEAIINPDGQVVRPIHLGCNKVATDFGDLGLVLLYWEALFFGGQWEHEQSSEWVLDSIPSIVDHLDIDSILRRCDRYRTERNYRRLVEMCLQRQCSGYVQSRVFESMLQYQVNHNNLAGAAETIKCAKSLDIKLTADYLLLYINAKKEADKVKESSLLHKFRNIFNRK